MLYLLEGLPVTDGHPGVALQLLPLLGHRGPRVVAELDLGVADKHLHFHGVEDLVHHLDLYIGLVK